MNVKLVVNPTAGRCPRHSVSKMESLLKNRCSLSTHVTRKKGDAREIAGAGSDTDLIVIAGGDGTINEVINGVMAPEKKQAERIRLAAIPTGTANVLAAELGIPMDIAKAVDVALTGNARKISLGRVNGRFFALMTGIGFDAETVLGVKNGIVKKMFGKAAFILSGIKVLSRYDPPVIRIKTPERDITGYNVITGNARCYGGRFSVTPHADISEPLLDVCVLKSGTRRDLLRFVAGVIRKRHLSCHDVSYFKTTELEVISEDRVHIQADGDYLGELPAKIDVVKEAVHFIS